MWRKPPTGNAYSRVGYSTLADLAATDHQNVYELVPSSPLSVQVGDILGIFQPEESEVTLYYHQRFGGPINYRKPANLSHDSGFVLLTSLVQDVDLPLVAVEIGEYL